MNDFENKASTEENIKSSFQDETSEVNEVPSAESETENSFGSTENRQPPVNNDGKVLNQINYTPVMPVNDYKPASKGLRVFAVVMCCAIIATACCVAGYFLGKNDIAAGKGTGKKVSVQLAQKPKDGNELTAAGVYEQLNDSVVGIRVYNSTGKMADASGVIYTKDGYIITNDHIYSEIGAPKFKVYTSDGTEHEAVYVAGDTVSDLAVLKIKGDSFKAATLGDSSELICGEGVVAVGRPSDAMGSSSITDGVVSLPKRRVKTTSNYTANLIQTDSAINPGSSGGALVNMYGQVVGITSAKLAGVDYDSVGYAIPSVTVKRVAEQLIKDGKVTDRAKLGITYKEMNSVAAEINNSSNIGLYVASVSTDSDAYGKLNEGDIITEVNGQKIVNDDVMLDIVDESRAGDTINITVSSANGNTSSYDIKLKANIGESSYSDTINQDNSDNNSSNGGTFNFPNGD